MRHHCFNLLHLIWLFWQVLCLCKITLDHISHCLFGDRNFTDFLHLNLAFLFIIWHDFQRDPRAVCLSLLHRDANRVNSNLVITIAVIWTCITDSDPPSAIILVDI